MVSFAAPRFNLPLSPSLARRGDAHTYTPCLVWQVKMRHYSMAIIGIGIDLIEVPRIRQALSRPKTGERFKARVFTDGEIAYCERRRVTSAQSYAARFAAKEATMKALGRGFGGGLGWREIEVVRGRGAPRLILSGAAQRLAVERGIERLHLSLTHTAEQAIAYVIAEGPRGASAE